MDEKSVCFAEQVHFIENVHCELRCRVTGKWVNRGAGYGLVILITYEIISVDKAVDWF